MPQIPVNLAEAKDIASGYPPGLYKLAVEAVEFKATNDGTGQRMVVKNKIIMGPGPSEDLTDVPFTDSFPITEKSAGFLKQFIMACGFTQEYLMQVGAAFESDLLIGREFMATMGEKNGYSNLGKYKTAAEFDTMVLNKTTTPTQQPILQPIQQPPVQQQVQQPPMQQQVQQQVQQPPVQHQVQQPPVQQQVQQVQQPPIQQAAPQQQVSTAPPGVQLPTPPPTGTVG